MTNIEQLVEEQLAYYIAAGGDHIESIMQYTETDYHEARREHAFLLRCEGLKFWEIGDHLGVGVQRCSQMTRQYSRRLKRAMRRTRVYYTGEGNEIISSTNEEDASGPSHGQASVETR